MTNLRFKVFSIGQYGGIILKKSTSLLLSGILVSGMVLGTIVTPVTVNAATQATTQADQTVTNYVTFLDADGNTVSPAKAYQGTKGQKITVAPDGFTSSDSSKATFGNDGDSKSVTVTKMISVKVNYVDQNGKLVNSETVNGGNGNDYKLTNLPAGCTWNNDAEQTINLVEGKEYNVPVTKKVSNTVIFKTADETEVGRTEIFGDKAGIKVSLTDAQLPEGYTTSSKDLTLQNEGNTQFVTVTKSAADGIIPIKGIVKVTVPLAHLYDKDGKVLSRSLTKDSRWQTNNKMILNGITYYQVSTTEWLKLSDILVEGSTTTNDKDNNSSSADTTAQKSDVRAVTTKNAGYAQIYDDNGKAIVNLKLGPNTPWATDLMKTQNGVKMYRVATNQWIKVSEII